MAACLRLRRTRAMLESKRVLISMPTKTGTRSLEAAARKEGDFHYKKPRHGILMAGANPAKQPIVMMVREPHARLLSMYHHLARHMADKHIQPIVEGLTFAGFIRWLSEYRDDALMSGGKNPLKLVGYDFNMSPWRWVLTQREMEAVGARAGFEIIPWRTESMRLLPAFLNDRYGMKLAAIGRVNTADDLLGAPKERRPAKELYTSSMVRLAAPWLRDGTWFGYAGR
jgi:hypothetical protein